MDFLPL